MLVGKLLKKTTNSVDKAIYFVGQFKKNTLDASLFYQNTKQSAEYIEKK